MTPSPDLRRTVLTAGGVTIALGVVLYLIGSLPHSLPEAVLLVLLAAAAASLVIWALGRTGQYVERAYWVSTPRQEATAPSSLDYRLLRLRRDLRDALERDDRPDQIYPVLRELAVERLRAHHEIDLDSQPEQAQRALDPVLWRYLTTPPRGVERRSHRNLQSAVTAIERL